MGWKRTAQLCKLQILSILYKDQFVLLKLDIEIKILKKTLKTKHVVFIQINNKLNGTSLATTTNCKIIFVLAIVMCNAHYSTQSTKWVICNAYDKTHIIFPLVIRTQNSKHVWNQTSLDWKFIYNLFINTPFVSIKKKKKLWEDIFWHFHVFGMEVKGKISQNFPY